MIYAQTRSTPIGQITLVEKDGALIQLDFGEFAPAEAHLSETPLLGCAAQQLAQYFSGRRKAFELPLAPEGTSFQLRCWNALRTIPYGETRTYAEEAAEIGNPRACRAVGMANNRNPLPILIPCHRVIGKNGTLVGYGGGLTIKEALLKLEKENAQRWSDC